MIFISEILDKTFLISAVMSMKHPRIIIFFSSVLALALMTVISVALGVFLFTIIPVLYTKIISAILFLIFGIIMLVEGFNKKKDTAKEELKEICSEIEIASAAASEHGDGDNGSHVVLIPTDPDAAPSSLDSDEHTASTSATAHHFSQDHIERIGLSLSDVVMDPELDHASSLSTPAQSFATPILDSDRLLSSTPMSRNLASPPAPPFATSPSSLSRLMRRLKLVLSKLLSPAFVQTFGLCFLAEWGDRSQIATIALAASKVRLALCLYPHLSLPFCISNLQSNATSTLCLLCMPLLESVWCHVGRHCGPCSVHWHCCVGWSNHCI